MITFIVKEEHIKLLRNSYTGWDNCEFGSPEIDCKRPYGNGDVISDMIRILFGELPDDIAEKIEDTLYDYLVTLHRETETVLQIALRTGQFKAGKYQSDDYKNNWVEVKL